MGRLKGAARHCDKMVMHTLEQGLEDDAIAEDVMKEYATNDTLQNRLTLEKIEKLIEAKESTKRSMAELRRA